MRNRTRRSARTDTAKLAATMSSHRSLWFFNNQANARKGYDPVGAKDMKDSDWYLVKEII